MQLSSGAVGPEFNIWYCKENRREPRGVVVVTGNGDGNMFFWFHESSRWLRRCIQTEPGSLRWSVERISLTGTGGLCHVFILVLLVQNILLADDLTELCGLPGLTSLSVNWNGQGSENDFTGLAHGSWPERMHSAAEIPMVASHGYAQQLVSEYPSKHHDRIALKTVIWLDKNNHANFYYFQHFIMKDFRQCSHLLAMQILQLFCGCGISIPCLFSILFSDAFLSELWTSVLH